MFTFGAVIQARDRPKSVSLREGDSALGPHTNDPTQCMVPSFGQPESTHQAVSLYLDRLPVQTF